MPSPQPPSTGYTYYSAKQRYRSNATGLFIKKSEMQGMRDTFIDGQRARTTALTDKLIDGKINVQQWEMEMRKVTRQTYAAEYAAAKGGIAKVTKAEWSALGQPLKDQYKFLSDFARQIADGKLSPAQVDARAKLYVEGASAVYEKGKGEAHNMPKLDAYPGDGQTVCRSNCRCMWDIKETDTEWLATWVLGEAEHCPDCVANAEKWNPLVIAK